MIANWGLAAGAMTILDTEPLDGVDYRNGVVGYITLVCSLPVLCCSCFVEINFPTGNPDDAHQEWNDH